MGKWYYIVCFTHYIQFDEKKLQLGIIGGGQAIQIATNQYIDLILMDIGLPDLNGYEATHIINLSQKLIL